MAKRKGLHRVQKNLGSQSSENDTRNQPYLMPKTPVYEDTAEELKLKDPFEKDTGEDTSHEKLAEHNVELAHERKERNEQATREDTDVADLDYARRIQKEARLRELQAGAMRRAAGTDDKSDDKQARALDDLLEDAIRNDPGFTVDDVEDAVDDLMP